MLNPYVSVVTPTLHRPAEVRALLENLAAQTVLPLELILVDGAPADESATQNVVQQFSPNLPFAVRYIRHSGGTAIQRNTGIDAAQGNFIAFIDDDIRLSPDFFALILTAFEKDTKKKVGGVTGYITNQYLDPATSRRWQWYRRLKLFTTYEPGQFDYQTGYPINRYLQPPHDSLKLIDFMGIGCSVWRKQVFDRGLRFDEFFVGFGVLEDAHMSLRARQEWQLFEYGRAHCQHLHAAGGRENEAMIARKTAINARYLFITIVPQRTFIQEFRFWSVQAVQVLIYLSAFLHHPNKKTWNGLTGKLYGLWKAFSVRKHNAAFDIP